MRLEVVAEHGYAVGAKDRDLRLSAAAAAQAAYPVAKPPRCLNAYCWQLLDVS